MYLESYATTLATKEQLAIREFADALLAIPRTLSVNAAKDSTELVARLCAFHSQAQASAEKSEHRFMGLDLIKGTVVNNLAVGVVEPAMSKVKSLKFATEAAITILRIDVRVPRLVLLGGQGGGMRARAFCVLKATLKCTHTLTRNL